jgi:Na+/H+ antiporter NhaD/arsenite permease-like protein
MQTLTILIFVLGYLAIAFEHPIRINKSATALVTGVLCWTVYILFSEDKELVSEALSHHLSETSGILFFLMGAMTIVELVDAHDGFQVITNSITTTDKRKLLWLISIITFFLSAILDNLTTTIVMISLCRKLIDDRSDRLFFAGIIVIAANAGGAWSPIGDVTTTMLWINGQITAGNIMRNLFLPSIACLLAPLIFISFRLKGKIQVPEKVSNSTALISTDFERKAVFFMGMGALIFVPIFKTITHLPPFMGVLLGLGVMWILTELIHSKKDDVNKNKLSVSYALQKIDTASILFFLGILVSIAALQSMGTLTNLSAWLAKSIGNDTIIVTAIGLLSSIIDNVPLVAAAQGMYDMTTYPPDHYFWEFLAYCAGTGGSILIIGSAAGVAAMGMERIEFFWYLKKISLLALIGYVAGAVVYVLEFV